MVEYLSRCNRREACECELVRGCGQSWLVVGEEWLKERMRAEDDTIILRVMLTIATC